MDVRGLFNKMFQRQDNSPHDQRIVNPVLPRLSLEFVKERAIIGWMANRMGEYLSWNKGARDFLFFKSFLSKEESDENELLKLSELMFQWCTKGENVPEKIKHKRLAPSLETAFLNVYREYSEYCKRVNSEPAVIAQNDPNGDLNMWGVYRDVMYAATQRRFLLISNDELEVYMQGTILLEQEVKERADIAVCREKTKDVFQTLGIEPSTIMSWQLAISEAVTNILKHAEYGRMSVMENGEEIQVIIMDKGPGFALNELPNTVLMAGYSTKKSLGQGFTLMMKMTHQVLLNTTPNGSTIILIFKKAGRRK
ncbi:ATP-binding protein [Effusibacillus dendaii]|uniref:Histidine kinase/HSP90-like ATPase domain-containing protein n=1 Tax=Effusibacillus dendaii TaxID=2743772 RepID=A0A7I8D4I6_9BACL|nr:ATP-binding protein [Effusibacillus dendaii]BCJ85028.1 hypothetical protein skT53_00130 [Effusibacillus dendaii]